MSAAIAFDADAEALRAELRRKEDDLLLAARYGKNLLEENEQLKKDRETNRQERANLSEVSYVQVCACVCVKYFACMCHDDSHFSAPQLVVIISALMVHVVCCRGYIYIARLL